MYRLKTEAGSTHARKLEIKIPNFSHSEEKEYKETIRVIKSKSTTQPLKQKLQKEPIYNSSNSPLSKNPNFTKLMKIKWDSKSPKNKSSSPAWKEMNASKMPKESFHTNLNTTRNIDDVKKKLQSYKAPMRLNTKYFKKELNVNEKLEDMNKTLKKVAELKSSKKPKYELKMVKKLGKSQTGEIILAISNINNIVVALKSFQKEKVKL
jgi:hypothetical protein